MRDKCHMFFETLATCLKMEIIFELKKKPLNVNELSKRLKEERSKISHALLSLHECGFVKFKKKGKKRIYTLNSKTIIPLLKLVDKHVKKYCKVCKKIKLTKI